MKIYWNKKTAGIDDFAVGVKSYDLDQLPPENELTESDKEQIRRVGFGFGSSSIKAKYFLKYPNIAYFSIFDLKDYAGSRWDSEIELLTNLCIEKIGTFTYINEGFNDKVYEKVIRSEKRFEINAIVQVFKSKEYPQFFVDYMRQKYPEIWSSFSALTKEKLEIVRNFLMCPSYENGQNAKSALEFNDKNPEKSRLFIEDIYRLLLDFEAKDKQINSLFEQRRDRSINSKGKDIAKEINKVFQAKRNGTTIIGDEDEISYLFDDSFKDRMHFFHIGGYRVSEESLVKIFNIVSENPESYYSIIIGRSDSLGNNLAEDKRYVMLGDLVVLQNEDNDPVTYEVIGACGKSSYVQISDYSNSAHSVTEATYSFCLFNHLNKTDIYAEWYEKNKPQSGSKEEKYFYLNILNSDIFKNIHEIACQNFYEIEFLDYLPVTREQYQENQNRKRSILPSRSANLFVVDLLKKILKDIPPDIKWQFADNLSLPFVLASGEFSSDIVLKKGMKDIKSDNLHFLDHMSCSDGNEDQVAGIIQKHVKEKEKNLKKVFDSRIKDFMNQYDIKPHYIKEFPELHKQIYEMTRRLIDSEKQYSYEESGYTTRNAMVFKNLEKTPIYFIDAENFQKFFDAEVLDAAGYNPEKVNGFFAQYSAFSDYGECIVVFLTKKSGDYSLSENAESTLTSLLGIGSYDDSMRLQEESTLWHEMTHAVMNRVVPGQSGTNDNQNEWLRSPSELIAIHYGQLGLIKKHLFDFFSNNVPASGRITAGLIEHLKNDIIKTFSWEFQGMTKIEAIREVSSGIEDFEKEISTMEQNMSREEKIKLLVDLFAEFYLGKFMKSVADIDLKRFMEDNQTGKIGFKEDPVIPEIYAPSSPGKHDEIISNLEKRQDYKTFFANVQNKITLVIQKNRGKLPFNYRRYVHRNDQNHVQMPWDFKDLMKFIFEGPVTFSENKKQKNSLFYDIIPESLWIECINILDKENALRNVPDKPEKFDPVNPEEAEEAGQFMAQMDNEYGPDWMWVAKTESWYKKAMQDLISSTD